MAKKSFNMVKKTFIVGLAACCLDLNAFAQVQNAVKITDITFNGNEVNVGTQLLNNEQDDIRMVVSKSGEDKAENVVWVSEAVSDPNGKKIFDFIMPDKKNGQDTTGEYKILLKTDGSEISAGVFYFVSSDKREETIALINSMNAQNDVLSFKELFKDGNIHKNAMAVMGVPVNIYDGLSDAKKTECAEKFLKAKSDNLTQDSFRKAFIDALSIAAINDAAKDDISTLLELADPEYDGKKYSDITDASLKSWISSITYDERPYDDMTALTTSFKAANVLYKINNAKYSQLEQLFADNAVILGISGDSSYSAYCSLDSTRKVAANERIVKLLSSTPARKCTAVAAAIKTAVDAVKNINTSSDISGGSSSTKGESSGVSVGIAGTGNVTSNKTTVSYSDIDNYAWAKEAIISLSDKGIVSGAGDGRFEPGRNITREEFVKMIVLAADIPNEKADIKFSDVKENDWYYTYVERAVKAGVVNGKSDTLFGAGETLTRQDMLVIAERAFGKPLNAVRESARFADADKIADYALKSVNKAYAAGLVDGFEDNTFRPYDSCTRAMAAKVIYNMFVKSGSASESSSTGDSDTKANDAQKYAEEISLLSGLDIYSVKADEENGFDADSGMTYEDFAGAVLGMKYGKNLPNADIMTAAGDDGIISAEDTSKGKSKITSNQAIKILLNALGYSPIAESSGGYPQGYIVVARELDLFDGAVNAGEGTLTAGNMLKILVNAIDAPVAEITFDTAERYSYKKTEGKTLLSEYRDIHRLEGTVNRNSFTSLNDASSLKDNEVEINGTIYDGGTSGAGELLGRYVYGYAEEKDGSGKLLFAAPDKYKNKEIEILAEDLVSLDDKCTVLEYETGNGKTKKANLSVTRRVIYNGVVYNDFTKNDILIKSGSIRLLDSDKDDVYDTVFVTTYDSTVLVSYISSFEKMIYNQYENSKAVPYVELYEEDGSNKNIILLDGKEIKFTDIAENDVVSVSLSKNPGKNIARVYVSRDTVTGTLVSYNLGDLEMTIEDESGENKTYNIHPMFVDELTSNSSSIDPLSGGRKYTFRLDVEGRVASAVTGESTGWEPVMLLKMYREENVSDSDIGVKYMKSNGEWVTAKLSDKVEYQNVSKTAGEVCDILADSGDITPQIAMIKIDKDGNVRKLRTATVTDTVDKNLLTEKTLDSAISRPSGAFGDFEYYRDDNAAVFIMPPILSDDMDDYSVSGSGYFEINQSYSDVKLYNLDEFNFTDLIAVTKKSDTDIIRKQLFVVSNILSEVEDDGEVFDKLYGSMGNMSMISASVEDSELITSNNVCKGDVIQMTTNNRGRVDNIRVVHHIADGISNSPAVSKWDDPSVISFSGTVSRINAAQKRMTVMFEDGTETTIRLQDSTNVNVYDQRTEQVTQQRMTDIKQGDFIVAQTREMILSDVIVIRFED